MLPVLIFYCKILLSQTIFLGGLIVSVVFNNKMGIKDTLWFYQLSCLVFVEGNMYGISPVELD